MNSERLRALIEADPEAARKFLKGLNEKIVVPHTGGQVEVLAAQERFQVLDCGRRWGKTKIGAQKAVRRARKHKQMVWWVAPTYKVVKRGYREVLRQLPDGLLTHTPPQDSAFDAGRSVVLKLKNGSRMEFYSAERPEGMLGEGVDFAVLDEAALMSPNIWEQTVRPTLMDRQGGALMISTPRGRNWFYYMYLRGQDPDFPDYVSWQHPSSDNPYLAPEEIEEMEATLPRIMFEQEVLAQFVSNAAAVFRFDGKQIVAHGLPKGHIVVGVDLAKSQDFTVFSACRVADRVPCGYDRFQDVSWPMQRNRLKSFVRRLKREGAEHVTLVMDSTGVGDPIVDDMEADGYDVVPVNFTKTKQHMVMQLSKDLEDGYALLSPERVEEFENYTYTITNAGRYTYAAPEGQHDDVVSAKLLQHWGLVWEGAPNMTAVSGSDPSEPEDEDHAVQRTVEGEVDEDDWSDLLDDDEVDSGVAEVTSIKADSPAAIMARPEAWN
jgi:hypothetical protein